MAWLSRLLNLFRPNELSHEIDREMAFHVGERTDELVATGMTRYEAAREARRRFGNYGYQKEETRNADLFLAIESFVGDVRYALRALRASPVFALVTVLSLGLGIGANTAIFSLINAVVIKSLPVSHPEELFALSYGNDGNAVFTNPLWEQIRERQSVFTGAFAYGQTGFNLAATGEMRQATGNWVSGDYFATLGVRPAAGRLISRADDVRGCRGAVVLGYGFWQSEFAGSPNAVGKTLSLGGHPFEILGVAQEGFLGLDVGRAVQVFAPICTEAIIRGPGSALDRRSNWWLYIIGRAKPGLEFAQIRAGVKSIAPASFGATVPPNWAVSEQNDYRSRSFDVAPAATGNSQIRRQYSAALYALMGVVGIVLLVACANVANLLLARATTRQREIAIRLAMGAGRGRLVRQLLTESVLLSMMGATLGVLFARWGSQLLVRFLSTPTNAVALDLSVDTRVLLFTITVAVVTGVLFGLAPAWRSSRVDPQAVMKAGGRGLVGPSRFAVAKGLVATQVALSLVLLVASGLLLGSFRNLSTMDAGFQPVGVLVTSVDARATKLAPEAMRPLFDQLLARLRATPGLRAAALADMTPIGGSTWNDNVYVDGFSPKSQEDQQAYFNRVSDGYFTTLGTPFIAGRDFGKDDTPSSTPVAIINESMAKHFFNGQALGKHFRIKDGDNFEPAVEVVGVVKDAKYARLREDFTPTAYYASSQEAKPGTFMNFVVRGDGPATALVPSFKSVASETNGSLWLRFASMETQVATSITRERLLATLSGFFGGLALVLAMIGLYGIMSYTVTRRRNEIGIRIALGAARARVVRMVLGEVGRIVVVGLMLGTAATLATTRLLASLLYGVKPFDRLTLAVSAFVLLVVALGAGLLPAYRASKLDPMDALREE